MAPSRRGKTHYDCDVARQQQGRPAARERYLGRYSGYLRQGVHLLLIDVLPRPVGFSFADALAVNLGLSQPPCPAPCAVSYRVGEPVPEGTVIALWRRPLKAGQPLPVVQLALGASERIPIAKGDFYLPHPRFLFRAFVFRFFVILVNQRYPAAGRLG